MIDNARQFGVDDGRLRLTLMIGSAGSQQNAWRRPDSPIERVRTLGYYAEIAQAAEDARFDALFIADVLSLDPASVRTPPFNHLEPVSLMSAIAARTSHIGLVATLSTTFTEPYNLARQVATLDHLSDGRAAWNAVTSFSGEENFGSVGLPSPGARYARAGEYIETVLDLWDSWEDDAIQLDRAGGLYADPDKIHRINHQGEHFQVFGPLNIARTPQGRPVLFQSGASELGRDLAARYAEGVYTAQPTLEEGQRFYSDLKARIVAHGRDPRRVPVLTGVTPIIASTEAEARALAETLREPGDLEHGRKRLERQLGGIDLSGWDLDSTIPEELLPGVDTVIRRQGRFEIFRRLAVVDRLSIRDLIEVEVNSSGHWNVIGTARQVADKLEERFRHGASDGFNISVPYFPDGFRVILDQLIPELRRRGLFRHEYEGPTLRDQLGLARPASQYATTDTDVAGIVGPPSEFAR